MKELIIAVAFLFSLVPAPNAGAHLDTDSGFGEELADISQPAASGCNVKQGSKYNSAKLNSALNCLKRELAHSQAQLSVALKDIEDLETTVQRLKGLLPPMDAVSMYEDSFVQVRLTGAGKTVTDPINRKAYITLRLLIINKTSDTLYLAREFGTSSVADENGVGSFAALDGIDSVYANEDNAYDFTAIGPKSSLTVSYCSGKSSYDPNYYFAHYLTASFGFVRFDYAGNVRFNAGFTGTVLP